jgi:hypothetical protein
MIINQNNLMAVPDKTIAIFPMIPDKGYDAFNLKDVGLFLNSLNNNHKRDWFTPHFYKCLPLSIGNMQGFVFSLPFSLSIFWNGGNKPKDLVVEHGDEINLYNNLNFVYANSEFGNGILTIHFPITLKTPPGINLMTIAPPNFPIPGLSPMTGVVESDNIRFTFTINLKVDLANVKIDIGANYPLVGIIPIPRYFCDSFELKSAYDIFDKEIVEDEMQTVREHSDKRSMDNDMHSGQDRLYFRGLDIRGNKFKDHQIPKNKT